MESSEVRRHLRALLERARRAAADRRAKADEASREFPAFLENIAAPLFRQTASVLKAEGFAFNVFTPGGSVRLASDRNPQQFIELVLDTSGDDPAVMGHVSRTTGRRILESELVLARGPVRDVTEQQVLAFLTDALQPFLER
jgi:hypothetical protein